MSEKIRIWAFHPDGDQLKRVAEAYFDLSAAKGRDEDVSQLLRRLTEGVKNVSTYWLEPQYKTEVDEDGLLALRYAGDRIVFHWMRPLMKPEPVTDLDNESWQAVEAAAKAIAAAGYPLMPLPELKTQLPSA